MNDKYKQFTGIFHNVGKQCQVINTLNQHSILQVNCKLNFKEIAAGVILGKFLDFFGDNAKLNRNSELIKNQDFHLSLNGNPMSCWVYKDAHRYQYKNGEIRSKYFYNK